MIEFNQSLLQIFMSSFLPLASLILAYQLLDPGWAGEASVGLPAPSGQGEADGEPDTDSAAGAGGTGLLTVLVPGYYLLVCHFAIMVNPRTHNSLNATYHFLSIGKWQVVPAVQLQNTNIVRICSSSQRPILNSALA